MHLKIYFNEKPLFLCDVVDETIEPYIHRDDTIFMDELNSHTVKTMIYELQQEKINAGVFCHKDLEKLKKAFWKKFTLVVAAGGLVKNEKGEVLMIFRRNKWDLPKGKLDDGEEIEKCALREVKEETGLEKVNVVTPINITYHTYHEGTKLILKESHWFLMQAASTEKLTPQATEDITDIKWADKYDLYILLQTSFPLVMDVFTEAYKDN